MASSYQTSANAPNYNTTAHHQKKTHAFQRGHHTAASNFHHQGQQEVAAVVVPFPAQGHLNQLLHLSRLILSHNIPVHFVGTPTHNRQVLTRVQGWDPQNSAGIQIHDFKVPPFVSPPPNPSDQTTKFPSHLLPSIKASSNHLRAPVASLLRSLSSKAKRVVVIHDSLMASVIQDAADIPNCESYTFHSVSAFTMFLYFWDAMGRPLLVEEETSHRNIPEVPSLEGCFPRQFIELIASQYEFHKSSKGTIYNTTRAVEKPYMELIERMVSSKTHWALGPFNPLTVENRAAVCKAGGRHPCMDWLDKQDANSVMYVSFGTTTAFTGEQIKELAIGLERSKVKFVWVLRDADKGDVFDDGEEEQAGEALPKGFEERSSADEGIVVRDWAPQLEILGHPATGGFMSHCGWNSCMESITMGVPIAAWPMHSDQPRNRVLITEVLRVGLVVMDWERREEVVRAPAVENAVRRLMASEEGEAMRERAMRLRSDIHESRCQGGVSRVEMDSFIAHITR